MISTMCRSAGRWLEHLSIWSITSGSHLTDCTVSPWSWCSGQTASCICTCNRAFMLSWLMLCDWLTPPPTVGEAWVPTHAAGLQLGGKAAARVSGGFFAESGHR